MPLDNFNLSDAATVKLIAALKGTITDMCRHRQNIDDGLAELNTQAVLCEQIIEDDQAF